MVQDRFPGGVVTNLLHNFESFNEVIIGSEAEMRGYMVKYGERLLEGGGRGGGIRNSREVLHEQWCYGNCGIHRYFSKYMFPSLRK